MSPSTTRAAAFFLERKERPFRGPAFPESPLQPTKTPKTGIGRSPVPLSARGQKRISSEMFPQSRELDRPICSGPRRYL